MSDPVAPMPAQGLIGRGMSYLFGASWKTTVYGTIAAISTLAVGLAVAVSQAATSTTAGDVDPVMQYILYAIPSNTRAYIILVATVIAAISGQRFAKNSKSANVTGGTVQQDANQSIAKIQEPTPAPPYPAAAPSPLSEHREDAPAPKRIE